MADLWKFALARARQSLEEGDWAVAVEWLAQVPESEQPDELAVAISYAQAKSAAGRSAWGEAEEGLRRCVARSKDPYYQTRLGLTRRRKLILSDAEWGTLVDSIDSATRLGQADLQPQISGVWAAGAYFSRGGGRGRSMSKFLRIAKNPSSEPEERRAVLKIAGGYLARFLQEKTPLLNHVDVVIAIPPNRTRYSERMMSLPDELAAAVEVSLGLPFLSRGLVTASDQETELKKLSRTERPSAIAGTMRIGDLAIGEGRNVLLIDDLITSGSTMREAARVLSARVKEIFGLSLAHTEG